jgi:hypothetical protein
MHDIPAVIIQNGTQVIPTPSQDFKVRKIGLPHLMNKACFVGKLIWLRSEKCELEL